MIHDAISPLASETHTRTQKETQSIPCQVSSVVAKREKKKRNTLCNCNCEKGGHFKCTFLYWNGQSIGLKCCFLLLLLYFFCACTVFVSHPNQIKQKRNMLIWTVRIVMYIYRVYCIPDSTHFRYDVNLCVPCRALCFQSLSVILFCLLKSTFKLPPF